MGKVNAASKDFNTLRRILLRPTAQRLDELERRADAIEQHGKIPPTAEEISGVLPEAVRISARKSQEFATVLSPVVESALDKSITRNPERMVGALYPLLLPMIR